jgi:hypothetical protein
VNRALLIEQAGIPWLARMDPEPEPEPRRWIPYDFPLRREDPRERARLVLPMDMSTAEAERLCWFIRTLAFTDEELAAPRGPLAGVR